MGESSHRGALYGSAALVLGGIGIWWSVAQTEADVMTLLSSVNVQLRLAHGIPPVDKQGRPLDKRDALIESAFEQLDKVDRQKPDMAVAVEFRGFAHMLRGEFLDAAHCYERARRCSDVQDEQRDLLAFNQARMLAEGGEREQALAVFASESKALDARYGHQRELEEASILLDLGRDQQARQRLDAVVADEAASPMALLQAGLVYAEAGLFEPAENVYVRVRDDLPIADYYLAVLKLRQRQVDSSIELLERAFASRPAEVRQLLRNEAEAWSAVSGDERFEQLIRSQPASPGR